MPRSAACCRACGTLVCRLRMRAEIRFQKSLQIGTVGLLAWLMPSTRWCCRLITWERLTRGAAWVWNRLAGQPAFLIGDSPRLGQDLARLGSWISRHEREGTTLVSRLRAGDRSRTG